ncbi:MAG: LamG-like jellyroll fold domain-containing protein, partial [Patescibacteria group bacterium]
GEVYIKASTQGKSDQARLTVATLPIVIDKYPTDKTECRNVAIWALFNQKMDEKSFAGRYKIEANNVDVTNDFSLRFITEKEKTKVYFVPKNNFLEKDTTYKITLFGSPKIFGSSGTSGIRSIAPFEREMVDDVSWSFKTGEYICRLEKVIIEPSSYLFIRAKERKDFLARAYYRDQEIQKVPDLYEWKWSWQSTDPTIVTITNSDNPSQTAESQAKNGQVNILATAEITVDNIFIPSTRGTQKTGSANVEVWLCENPWPCTSFPDCQPYQDIKTNFEFKYCRDAGRAGLDGDLPILGGPGEITGPAEPGLQKLNEHFFSVYDGSLSFLYDGAKKFSVINKSGYNNQYYNIFGNNNASISGNVAQAEGKFGQGFSFDGNSYLEVRASGVPFGRNLTIEPENFSLEAWIYPFKPGTFGSSPSPVSYSIFRKGWKDDLSSTGQGYALEIIDDIVYFWISDKEGNITKIKGGPIPRDSWTHLAATYDGKTLKLYINGILQSEEQSLKGGITHSEINLYIGENFRGLLDEIAFYHRVLSQQEIEKHLKDPISPTLGDVIGFKVFSNFEHLKPEEWYQKYAPGAGGSGSYSSVDGYRAIQVGRTVYVGATNVDLTEEKIYTNIYLVSQSDNPQPETSQIFRRSINNWKFNINVPDPDLTTPENENKGKLIRDLQRIWDLKTVWQTLESYQKINTQEPNLYPRLESGTYIKGMSTSKWPSWTPSTGLGQDLVKAGLSPLPVDPINKFALRDNCGQEPTRYSCCANCPFKDPNCSQTCYNPKELKYECYQSPDGKKNSHIYQYMVEGNPIGKAYSLYANFEFLNPDAWQHQCEELPETECQKRAFCYWKYSIPQTYLKNKFILATEPSLPGSCKRKILNYSGNPCSNLNMNCACFNTRFSSEIIEPPSPPRITLTANPTQIYPGQSTTLSWTTENAERCEASSSPSHPQWSGEISLSGSKSITLNQTTIFTLECSGPGGQSQAQVQVDVIQQLFTLNVSLTGTGSGTVTGSGINCRPDCSKTYNPGTSVTLTANPASDSVFAGWSGDCSGTGSCTLTMNSNKSVTATFNLAINPPTVSTINATNITSNEAILNGLVNPNGSATTGWFRYSTTNPGTCNDNFGTRVPASGGISLGGGTSSVSYS